jgi:O-antigen ligase
LEKTMPHLWLGQGYFSDTFALHIADKDMSHAHNVFLATLRDGGIVGLLLLAAAMAAAGWRAFRQAQAANRYLNLSLMTFGVISVLFDNDRLVANPEELWVFFWYPLGRIVARDLVRDGHLGTTAIIDPLTRNMTMGVT